MVKDNGSAKRTKIMYNAYLSYSLLVRYLNEMLETGLLFCGEENCYKLTSKGEAFLDRFVKYTRSKNKVREKMIHVNNQKEKLEDMVQKLIHQTIE